MVGSAVVKTRFFGARTSSHGPPQRSGAVTQKGGTLKPGSLQMPSSVAE